MNLSKMYQDLLKKLPGRDVAEMEIEARRDARELQNLSLCPYRIGSFQQFCFIDELSKMRKENNGI